MDERTSRLRIGMAVALALVASACGGSGTAGRLSVGARTVTPAASPAPGGGLALDDGIVLTRVRLAVQRISLEAAGADGMGTAAGASSKEGESGGGGGSSGSGDGGSGGDDGGEGESGEVSVGPFAVDLGADALSGGVRSVFDGDVPAGTYRELRVDVGPVAAAAAESPLAAMDGRSFVVDGTIDGAPFTFASALGSTQKVEMTIPVAADGSSSGVTLTVDPSGWFRAADGSRLDPTLDASRAAIEDNVRRSIGAELEDEHEQDGGGADDGAGHT